MAELRERLEELERRMERAEAALRDRTPAALRLHAVPVRFEDVAVRFSRREWETLDEGQQELYRSVMEGNYEMLVSLYCALFKPELLLWLERGELSMLTESDVSPEPAVEPARPSCASRDGLLETKTMELGEGSCRKPGESGKPAEESRSLMEESGNLVEESGNPVEESRNPAEKSRSSAVPENCSASPIPLEAAVPVDLSQPTPSPPCLLSACCGEAVDQNRSPSPPPAAADAEVGTPMEVAQEKVAAEKPAVPETSSEVVEEKDLEQENGEHSGNVAGGPVADIPEEPGRVDPGLGKSENSSCVGGPAAYHRNAYREYYSCPICRRSFLLKINFLIHQRSHENLAPYVCVHCDRKFMSKKKMKRHLRAWAANGTCQPSEPEARPSRTPCPTSRSQTRVANGTCQPPDAQVCPSQVPCPTSQPQVLGSEVCPSRTPCQTSQPQTWTANGTCQPPDAKVCPGQVQCLASQHQTWAANGPCQASKPEACPSQVPCLASQPQTWAANGTCQASKLKQCPGHTPCPTSQPQTWAASGVCQPLSHPEACPSQTLCPASQPQGPSRDCGTVWEKPSPARCPLSPGKVMYTCSECLENFSSQNFLAVHQRRHSSQHLISCPSCNQSFTCVSDFVRQHWAHAGVRPYQCGICQKTFKRFSHLKEHRWIHMRQQRPFPCANPMPIPAGSVAGDRVGSQGVTSQGCCAAVAR